MDKNPESSRLPSLDGWRAVSIAIVLAAHSSYLARFPVGLKHEVGILTDAGNLGVRFFFVISGFLITWLLLGEHAAGSGQGISLTNFYIRRLLRIFPVYFFFLAVVGGLQMVTPFTQDTRTWLGNLTFSTNFFGDGRLTGHLWSLAIEEQFYLLWPGTFLLFGLAANPRRAFGILAIPIFLGPVSRIVVCKHYYPDTLEWFFRYFPTTSFADSLAVGCVCAFVLFHQRERVAGGLRKSGGRLPAAGFLLLLIPCWMNQFQLPGRLIALTGHTLQAAGFAILLLDSVIAPEKSIYQFLNHRLVKHIGVLSYSIYIWQQIFCNPQLLGLNPQTWWMSFPGWLVPGVLVALLSYYGLEMPFFRLRKRYGSTQKEALKTGL